MNVSDNDDNILNILFFVVYLWISKDDCRLFVRFEDVILIGMLYV